MSGVLEMKEINLTEKRMEIIEEDFFVYPEKDVKEFIKINLEDLDEIKELNNISWIDIKTFIERFKQRAGDKLK